MSNARAVPWAWLAAMMLMAAQSRALSLRSTRAEAFLGEHRPGSRVSYSKAVGAPLGVENAGGEPASVELSLAAPPPGTLADGYEPLPPAWAKATMLSFALDPGKSGETDITVTLPKDASLDGRQFQLECGLAGRAPGGSALTLRTRLYLAVGDGDPPDCPSPPEWELSVSPRTATLPVSPGRIKPLAGPGFSGVKVANGSDKDAVVRVRAVRVWPEGMSPPPGFVAAPNPRWLSGGSPLTVRGGSVGTAELALTVPKDPRYRGKKWAFLVAVDVESAGRKGRYWLVLAVEVAS